MDPKTMRERVHNRLAAAGRWYDIRNAADDGVAIVRIYDEIGYFGVTAESFARDLMALDVDEIEVRISSPGGEVFDGVAIYNALRSHSARITTYVDGIAASIASVIAQAGDHRVMLSGSQMMIHEAHGIAIGPASEMREFADLLERQNENIAAIYAERSGGKAEDFIALMADGDTWLSAAETVERGLADEVMEPAKKGDAKASITVKLDDAWTERFAQLEQAVAAVAALQTPPAQRESTSDAESEVNREDAERLLASFVLNQEEAR